MTAAPEHGKVTDGIAAIRDQREIGKDLASVMAR